MNLLATVLRKIHAARARKGWNMFRRWDLSVSAHVLPFYLIEAFGCCKHFFRGPLHFSATPEISRSGRCLNSRTFRRHGEGMVQTPDVDPKGQLDSSKNPRISRVSTLPSAPVRRMQLRMQQHIQDHLYHYIIYSFSIMCIYIY